MPDSGKIEMAHSIDPDEMPHYNVASGSTCTLFAKIFFSGLLSSKDKPFVYRYVSIFVVYFS